MIIDYKRNIHCTRVTRLPFLGFVPAFPSRNCAVKFLQVIRVYISREKVTENINKLQKYRLHSLWWKFAVDVDSFHRQNMLFLEDNTNDCGFSGLEVMAKAQIENHY